MVAAPEAEDQPDRGTDERTRLSSLAARESLVGRTVRPDRVPPAREVTRLRAYFVWSPPAGCRRERSSRPARRRSFPRSGWSADEKIRRAPRVRTRRSGSRSSTTRPARTGTRRRSHPRSCGRSSSTTSRATAGTTSATTSSSTASGGLRRPVRRDRAQCRRRARRGLQHRVGRRRGDRATTARFPSLRRLATRLRAARLAARPRPRRSRKHAVVHLRRQRAVPGRPAGLPPTVSGHRDTGFDGLPGNALYTCLTTIAGEVATIGLPKLYAPVVTGAVPGGPSGSRHVFRPRSRGPSTCTTRPGTPSPRARGSERMSTGAGTRPWPRRGATRTRSAPKTTSLPRPGRSAAAAAASLSPSASPALLRIRGR